jgi:transposase
MIRMLLIGYCLGIRSERRLCEEVHLNLADRWFCRLGLDGAVPDHSTFSKKGGFRGDRVRWPQVQRSSHHAHRLQRQIAQPDVSWIGGKA